MHSHRRGWTLMDLMVATTAAGVVLTLVLAALPTATMSQKRAQDLHAATAYGQEVVDATRSGLLAWEAPWETRLGLNGTVLLVRRTTRLVPGTESRLADVTVTVTCQGQTQPVLLTTRFDVRRGRKARP